jgi:hypothetical protein
MLVVREKDVKGQVFASAISNFAETLRKAGVSVSVRPLLTLMYGPAAVRKRDLGVEIGSR